MKKLLFLFSLAMMIFLNSCKEDKLTCKIVSPYNGQSVLISKDLIIKIEATSTKSSVTKVMVYYSSLTQEQPYIITVAPYTVTIPSQLLTLGKLTIKAVATNSEGKEEEISVTVDIVENIDNGEKESPDFVTFADGNRPDSWKTYTWEIANKGYDDNYSLKSTNPTATVYTNKTLNAPTYIEFYTNIIENNSNSKDIDLYIDDEKAQALSSEPVNNNWVKWIYSVDSGKHAFRWQTEGALKYLDAITFAPAQLAMVTTVEIHSVNSSSAVSGGNVESHGNSKVFARGVCWNTEETPTIDNFKTTNNYGLGSFTSYLVGLTPNTTYYIRAYATNSVGTAYGEQKSFTTE
ncbi:MAG: hypothetical protein FWF70_04955 [Bacteroidetes bacterium]|nr:hypothetical protein [Bacteroidota bacterium]MCL1969033.1 hypothetical protein [Bacteroidota bacterium]